MPRTSRTSRAIAFAASAALLLPASAAAQIGGDYGVLTFGDFTLRNSQVAGRVAAGGSLSATSFGFGGSLPAAGLPTLVAGGDLHLSNGSVGGGGVVHGGSAAIGGIGLPHGSSQGTFLDFLALREQQTALSTTLAGLDATGTVAVTPWRSITLTGHDGGTNVFSLDAGALAGATSFTIDVPTSSTVIINVGGLNADLRNFGFSLRGVGSNAVLFNFFEASALSVRSLALQGSVLAPLATVTGSSGTIHGDFVAAGYDGSLTFQHGPFAGALPSLPPAEPGVPDVSAVPEPGTFVLLAGGLALLGMGAARRRRKE